MAAIRRREDGALVAASKAESALADAEARLEQMVAEQQTLIEAERAEVGAAYREVVEAFGSRSRAAEYLGVTPSKLRSILAVAPDVPQPSASQTSGAETSAEGSEEVR